MAIDPNSPLRKLYAGKNDMPVLMYPHDLGSSRKGHFITFSVLVPTKSTYKDSGAAKSSAISASSPAAALKSAQTAMNKVASTASAVTTAVGDATKAIQTAAAVANQALSTANQVVGSVASVVGVVAGAKSIISGSIATGSISGFASGVAGLSVLSNAATSIPGVSSFLNDPSKAASDAFNGIKDFINNPLKSVTGGIASKAAAFTNTGPKFTPSAMKPSGYINLYMPDTVSMSQHAGYGDISMTEALGIAGGVAEGLAESGSIADNTASLYDKLKGSKDLGSAIKTIKQADYDPLVLEGAGKIAGSTGVVANGGSVSKYLLKQNGYAINPQFEVVFTQMDFRRFQFDFTFTPKSKEEAATIRNIIKLFRYHSAPGIHGTNEMGRYFDVPAVFQIEYMHKEKKNSNLHSFAPCVLETIMVDYAPEVGWVSFEDGMPVKTRLTLQFKETEIMTRDKIQQGY
jgi:hypothetical protein